MTNNNSNKGYLSKYLKISKDKVPNGFSGFLGFTIQSFKTIRTIDITLSTKVHLFKAKVFSSSHVWIWEWDYKESWALKNWCFWTVVLEKTLKSPLDCKEIQSVHPKRNQSWIFIGRTDAEAEAPILCPPDAKKKLIWKESDSGKDWWWEEKGMTEDEMAGWLEFE